MSKDSFTHLQCQSEYSIKNSLIRIPELIEQIKVLEMDSIAITEDVNLFSVIKFYSQAIKNRIKPIIGAKITISCQDYKYNVLLFCQNKKGYLNLFSKAGLSA